MNSNEFSPYRYFNHLSDLWWLVLLTTILGGVFGFIYFRLHPSIYEATATYFVRIDMDHFPLHDVAQDLVQYNEDMALGTTEGVLISPEVLNDVILQLSGLGKTLTADDLLQNSTIERKHDTWELRYRSQDPSEAQTVVNVWAQIGYQGMLSWQALGIAPVYVIFQPPTLAFLPHKPVVYGLNNLILAGVLVGLIAGIVISGLITRNLVKAFNPENN